MPSTLAFIIAAVLSSTGCGDDGRRPPADAGPDSRVDSAVDGSRDALVEDTGRLLDADSSDAAADGGDGGTPSRIDALIALLEDPSVSEETLDDAIETTAVEATWPLVESDRILFATRWDDAPASVAMVSELNAWDPTAHPATGTATGVHYWVLYDTADATRALEGALYKWWGAPDVFRAPPESTVYGFDSFGEHGIVAPDYGVQHRQRFPLRSAHLSPLRALRFLLPAGFSPRSSGSAAARVLLMHDGQNVFDPNAFFGGWRVDEALAAPGYEDVVVVAVDNASDRFDAYTHVPDRIDAGPPVGGRAADYLTLLADEALPFARARFGLSATRGQTTVAGSSLGGLVSLVVAMNMPDLATCVIAMSPTTGWGAFDPASDGSQALANLWPSRVGHGAVAIYLGSGGTVSGSCVDTDGDGIQEDAAASDGMCTTNQLRDVLAAQGYVFGADLFHWYEPGAAHNEAAWATRLPRALGACETAGW